MSSWFLFLSLVPGAGFFYSGFRAASCSLAMIDEINLVVPPNRQLLYYGLDQFRAYRRYEQIFPDNVELPLNFRRSAKHAVLFFVAAITLLLLLSVITK